MDKQHERDAIVQRQIPKDAPVMKAWKNYQSTDEYANTRKWARNNEHVDGSLWAAFYAGYFACAVDNTAPPSGVREGMLRAAEIVMAKHAELAARSYPPPKILRELCGAITSAAEQVNADHSEDILDMVKERRAAEFERDARRYRWLAGNAPQHSSRWQRWKLEFWSGFHGGWQPLTDTELDAAIDAAIAREGGEDE